ncbi:leucine-rich repeat extensin-like protein 5 isoform X2 [Penaeus chinensis]|uniref:leucine-rich repeat extensin-like protein 5 isoform X2 n=1 Tax=Penaeus chinensis TaxID=139456 RepID=UPI001FB6A42B|nr:leucine-rich repeat extensin-like protein 5 isoform X2 [Penaeus chinensis]
MKLPYSHLLPQRLDVWHQAGHASRLPPDSCGEPALNGDDPPSEGKAKRRQHCTICKNHNKVSPKNRHKCPFTNCECTLCQLTRKSQRVMCHQQRLWRFQKMVKKSDGSEGAVPEGGNCGGPAPGSRAPGTPKGHLTEEIPPSSDSGNTDGLSKRQVCDKCRNHDIWVRKRGHKGNCPYEKCSCPYCSFTATRQKLMKHQQRVRRAQVTSQPGSSPQEFVLRPSGRSDATTDEMESPDTQPDNPGESPPQVGEGKDIAASESFPKITSPPAPPLDPASSPAPVAEPAHTQCWLEPYKEGPAQPSIPREVPETRSSAFQPPGYETSPIYTPAPTAHTPVNPHIKPDRSFDLTRCYESTETPKTFATPPQNSALRCPLPAQDFPTSVMSSMKPKFGVEPDDFQLRNWTGPMDNQLAKTPLGIPPPCVSMPLPQPPPPLSSSASIRPHPHIRPQPPIRPQPIQAPRLSHVHPHMGWSSVSLPYIASALLQTHHGSAPGLQLPRHAHLTPPASSLAAWWCPPRLCDHREAMMNGGGGGAPSSI